MALLFTALTEAGSRLTRPLHWLQAVLRHPITTLKLTVPKGWSERTLILLVMQTVDSSLRLKPIRLGIRARPLRLRRRVVLQTEQDPENPNRDVHSRGQQSGRGTSCPRPRQPPVQPR